MAQTPPDPISPGSGDLAGDEVRFAFRFAARYRLAGLPFGIGPATTGVVLEPAHLRVRFGPWRMSVALRNIAAVELSGPFAFLKTAGPARLAISDRGLTLATTGERGVRLALHHPIPGIEPSGLIRHPELTLTLDDLDRFVTLVEERRAQV